MAFLRGKLTSTNSKATSVALRDVRYSFSRSYLVFI